ncbi:MAG: SUMF1/EgtB/PvdO family nonheme iron enzyme [bacterium]
MVLILVAGLAGEALAQRSIRAVKKRSRPGKDPKQRVALVIGNSKYKMAPLRNPANDAVDMAAALKRSGFKVALHLDANRRTIRKAIRVFGEQLKRGGVGLFFYAGHGMQVKGVNYLIPVGSNIEGEEDVEFEAVSANRVLSRMERAGNRLNMVFLDACRNNPFARSFRSANQGLAAVRNAPKGSLISYATDAGAVAADGKGRNGTYTKNLLMQMKVPGLELSQMMKRVRVGVQKDTRERQTPYELSSLTGDFFFSPAKPGQAVAAGAFAGPPPRTIDPEEALWKEVQNSTDRADFQDYLREFPRGRFVRLARVKLRRLRRAAARPPARRSTAKRGSTGQAALGSQAGGPFSDPVTGMEFAWVPSGSFEMGCGPWNKRECDSDEKPVRTVRLGGFWIGKTEVTQGQWKKVMGENPSNGPDGDSRPVDSVSWRDAQAFISKLNKRSSVKYRLPREAEWEYACRAGGKEIKYGWGAQSPTGRKGAPNGARFKDPRNAGGAGIAPVGTFGKNGLGLRDMSGNLWEWVQDVYDKGAYSKAGMDNPVYERSGRYRVIRGGGWDSKSRSLRCAERYGGTPSYGAPNVGLRLVRGR